jgi:hypothetical protein
VGALRATPEASSGQVLHGRRLNVKNEVGALATSIIYEPKAFSIAESGVNVVQLNSDIVIIFKT